MREIDVIDVEETSPTTQKDNYIDNLSDEIFLADIEVFIKGDGYTPGVQQEDERAPLGVLWIFY